MELHGSYTTQNTVECMSYVGTLVSLILAEHFPYKELKSTVVQYATKSWGGAWNEAESTYMEK